MKFGQLRSPNDAGYADSAAIRGHDGTHRAFAAHGLRLLRRTNWSTVPVEERQEAVRHRTNPRRTAVTFQKIPEVQVMSRKRSSLAAKPAPATSAVVRPVLS
jgi:hypothetical protein